MEENAQRARAGRRIRVITHSLTAGLNLMNGFTTSSRELKSALFFLGGINVLAAIHYAFTETEEEKFLLRVAGNSVDFILVPTSQPVFALKVTF
ncbi:MAG: hypothetical protein H7301_06930 [Cryobacterium sp.]|nr:hypothetical protein [Oligoflexia bacterium]